MKYVILFVSFFISAFLKVFRIILFVKVSRFIALLGLFVITIIVTYNIKCPKNEAIPIDSLLVLQNNTHHSREETKERVKNLSQITLQQQNSNTQLFSDGEKERMQMHFSFIALFVFLLSPFLNHDKPNVRVGIVLTIFLFFLGYDLYDIHTTNLGYRSLYYIQNTSYTLNTLANNNPADFTWYDLDNKKFSKFDSTLHVNSLSRKVGNLLHPNLSQIAFYFLPLYVLLILYLALSISKNDINERDYIIRKKGWIYNRHQNK